MLVQRANETRANGTKTGNAFMLETFTKENEVVSRFTYYNLKTIETYNMVTYLRVPTKITNLFN